MSNSPRHPESRFWGRGISYIKHGALFRRSLAVSARDDVLGSCLYIALGLTYFFLPMSSSLKSIGVASFLTLSFLHPVYRTKAIALFKTPFGLATLGLVAFVFIACFWSAAPFHIAFGLFEKYAKYLCLPFFVVALCQRRYRLWMLQLTMAGVFCVSVLSICLHTDNLFRNHIIFGLMEAVAIYLCAYFAFHVDTWKVRLLYISVMLLLMFQLCWINGGRMAYLLLFMLGALWLFQFCSKRLLLVAWLAWGMTTGLIFMASPLMQVRVESGVGEWQQAAQASPAAQETSIGYRIQFHQYAKTLFWRHPLLGNGTGSYQVLAEKEKQFPNWHEDTLREPHSQYWLMLAEQGIMGLGIFFFWLFSLFLATFRLKETGAIACAMLLAFCLSQLSDSMLMYSGPGYFFMMIMAVCLGEAYENDL